MTEREYLLEMLCCLPKELLEQRIKKQVQPDDYWLNQIGIEIVEQALRVYDDPGYTNIRSKQV